MTHTRGKIARILKQPVRQRRAIDELTDVILSELRQDKQFVRGLRERSFLAIQRKCEGSIWCRLLTLAANFLNDRANESACARGENPPSPKSYLDWSHGELSSVMARIDEGLISNAVSVVSLKQTDKIASLSLPTLIAILVDLQGDWSDLGNLPPFQELRGECRRTAIGITQREFCRQNKLRLPPADCPTTAELRLLDQHFLEQPADSNMAAANGDRVWKEWGVGWLLTRALLGSSMRTESN